MDNAPDPKDNTNCTETSQLLEAGMMSLGTLPAPRSHQKKKKKKKKKQEHCAKIWHEQGVVRGH